MSDTVTRVVAARVLRGENRSTRVVKVRRLPSFDPEGALRVLRSRFEREWAELTSPGLLVAVASETGEMAWAWVAAGGRPRALTIGRHEQCDVVIAENDELSLRHLPLRCAGRRARDLGARV